MTDSKSSSSVMALATMTITTTTTTTTTTSQAAGDSSPTTLSTQGGERSSSARGVVERGDTVTVAYTARTAEGDVVASSSQGRVALIKAAVSHVLLPPCLSHTLFLRTTHPPSLPPSFPPSLHSQDAYD
jgi:hypothetical protein